MESAEARERFRQAVSLYREKRYGACLVILDELDASFPYTREVMYARALCLASLKRLEESQTLCDYLISALNDKQAEELRDRLDEEIAATGFEGMEKWHLASTGLGTKRARRPSRFEGWFRRSGERLHFLIPVTQVVALLLAIAVVLFAIVFYVENFDQIRRGKSLKSFVANRPSAHPETPSPPPTARPKRQAVTPTDEKLNESFLTEEELQSLTPFKPQGRIRQRREPKPTDPVVLSIRGALTFLALFLALLTAKRLPSPRMMNNILSVALVSIPVIAAQLLLPWYFWFVWFPLLFFLLNLAYEMEISEFLIFCAMFTVLHVMGTGVINEIYSGHFL